MNAHCQETELTRVDFLIGQVGERAEVFGIAPSVLGFRYMVGCPRLARS